METKTAKIRLREDGIIHVVLSEEVGTLTDAKINVEAVHKVKQGKKRPLLIDLAKAKSLSREERAYYSSDIAAKVLTAVALLINSPLSRILGNFFKGLNKPAFPLQLFTSEDEAIDWLKGFIE